MAAVADSPVVSDAPGADAKLEHSLELPCGSVLPNRIAKAALSEQLASTGNAPTERLVRLYERWGRGGSGLLLTGNVMIDRTALEEPRNVVIEDDRDLEMLSRWATAAQAGGGQCWVQISHPGRQSMRTLSPQPVGPSPVPVAFGHGLYATPRELTDDEIESIIDRFVTTARICKQAGFAGVQLHAAHGYLISSFLSPLTNLREDGWGGTPDKRMRMLREVYRRTRAEVGSDYPIGVKLNSADFQRGGFEEEESMAVVRMLEEEGIDLIEISGGSYENAVMMGIDPGPVRESTKAREAYFLDYAEAVRAVTSAPLMLTGGFRSLAGMQEAVASKAVDVVGLGRPLCINPELPRELLDGTTTLSVVTPKRVGVRDIDSILEVFWYTQQLHRIADGKSPAVDRNVWLALIITLATIVLDTIRLER